MQIICKITQVRSGDKDQMAFHVTITQGADQVVSDDDLLDQIKNSIPYKKGITSVAKLSPSLWKITANK